MTRKSQVSSKDLEKSLNYGRALLLLKFLYIYRNFSNSKAGPSIYPILKDLTSYSLHRAVQFPGNSFAHGARYMHRKRCLSLSA